MEFGEPWSQERGGDERRVQGTFKTSNVLLCVWQMSYCSQCGVASD